MANGARYHVRIRTKTPRAQLRKARSRPETLRQMRWANAMLKELSPQVLMS
ncbi:hypothetical protein ACKUT9_12195 [Mycobacterium seoulense]|uniref:Uncharacterized protein n=1 Tax=Mycobacterium seoulense TaxID=386911 RepID=A0A7I7P6V3_9MYCO|nr:hypothetical protein MSEO_47730 [Mycobacterium seoulense]